MTQDRPELDPEGVLGPPVTGEAAIDDVLLGLGELESTPVPEHHDRLARAHEVLQSALDQPRPPSP